MRNTDGLIVRNRVEDLLDQRRVIKVCIVCSLRNHMPAIDVLRPGPVPLDGIEVGPIGKIGNAFEAEIITNSLHKATCVDARIVPEDRDRSV